MTWFLKEQGYELFFNRDERLSRSHAELPKIHIREGIETISPTDADAGGTWISVNQYGVTVCLLNHYQFEQIATYKKWISRGEMVRQFELTSDLEWAERKFLARKLEDFRAFRMFLINPGGSNLLCIWDGHEARVEWNVAKPKSSTAVDAEHVKLIRRELFDEFGLADSTNSEDYVSYHASHLPTKSQDSVCMHRKEANTVSLSHIEVAESMVNFRYADGPPCVSKLNDAISIRYIECPVAEKLTAVTRQ